MKFEPGARVEILDATRRKWRPAIIENRRPMMTPEGKRRYQYEISTRDGKQWGKFDDGYVRAPRPRAKKRPNWFCKKHPRPCQGAGPHCEHW